MKRMSKISAIFCLAALAAFPVAGCNAPLISVFPHSSDETPTRRYVLSADAPAGTSAATFAFARIMVPSYLDVPQIVTRDGSEIHREEKNLWGEPLARGVARTLALRCAVAAAEKNVRPPKEPVRVALERFDGTFGGNVEISALYETETSGAHLFRATVPVPAPNDCAAYVHALDSALTQLAEDLVLRLSDKN